VAQVVPILPSRLLSICSSSASPIEDGPVRTPIERALIERARAGDPRAFRSIFVEHAPAVRRFLRDLLGDLVSADEATQETFVRAHGRLLSVRDSDRLFPWLLGIARNVFLEELRRRRRIGGEPPGDETIDRAPDPEAVLLGAEADRVLGSALDGLGTDRRTALLLRIDHELGYEDIAQVMGWTPAKVKNEVHRARLELRASLAEYLGGVE
jgi:RNA polymerase sigma-70 factor (ECF subfamily)